MPCGLNRYSSVEARLETIVLQAIVEHKGSLRFRACSPPLYTMRPCFHQGIAFSVVHWCTLHYVQVSSIRLNTQFSFCIIRTFIFHFVVFAFPLNSRELLSSRYIPYVQYTLLLLTSGGPSGQAVVPGISHSPPRYMP